MSTNATLARGIARRSVPILDGDGGEPTVIFIRGLSGADIAEVMQEDGGDAIGVLYTRITTAAFAAEDVIEIAADALGSLPDLAAKVIARAADLPHEWEHVKAFALGAQIDLLVAVAEMTFSSAVVGKKLMEVVSKLLAEKLQSLSLPSASKDGSGD